MGNTIYFLYPAVNAFLFRKLIPLRIDNKNKAIKERFPLKLKSPMIGRPRALTLFAQKAGENLLKES